MICPHDGPFAAMIFDEYALAIHACVLYYDNMGNPMNEKCWISERVWCDRKWGSDITSLFWCPNGKCLYIGTSLVYGDGGVFRLDLYNPPSHPWGWLVDAISGILMYIYCER